MGSASAATILYRDGNKRVAFVVMVVFLELNGLVLDVDEAEVVTVMLALADGRTSEKELAEWLRKRSRKRKGRGAV